MSVLRSLRRVRLRSRSSFNHKATSKREQNKDEDEDENEEMKGTEEVRSGKGEVGYKDVRTVWECPFKEVTYAKRKRRIKRKRKSCEFKNNERKYGERKVRRMEWVRLPGSSIDHIP